MHYICIFIKYMRAISGPEKSAVIVFCALIFIVNMKSRFIRMVREAENVRILKL